MKDWTELKIGDFLKRIKRPLGIDGDVEYKLVTIRLHHKGVLLRGKKMGSEIKSKMFEVREGDFILSGIDARNGAFGIVSKELNGAIVTNDFWYFEIDEKLIDKRFFLELTETNWFDEICNKGSDGTTQRIRLQRERFFNQIIKVPSLTKQIEIRNKLLSIKEKRENLIMELHEQDKYLMNLLKNQFIKITKDTNVSPMKVVAPIVRRKVNIDAEESYPELGIRSFGKGTFLKPSIIGRDLGSKKIYEIHKGDLLFSNVFSWEGAIAVVGAKGDGRYGSHRFISCVCDRNIVLPEFLLYYFLSEEGMNKIRKASPGSTSRNKTLGLKKLECIEVPIPDINNQRRFVSLKKEVASLMKNNNKNIKHLNRLDKALLNELFVDGRKQ